MEYYRFKEKNGCVYTIDWFTLEFHLLLSLAQWEELEEAVKSLGEKSKDYSFKSGTKLKGKYIIITAPIKLAGYTFNFMKMRRFSI